MIMISRSLARQFRAVVRRAGLGKPGPIGNGFIRLVATTNSLKLQASNGHVAIEHCSTGHFSPADVTVPIQLFADCEAKSDAQVMIRMEDSSRLIAAWDDRGVPQQRDYSVPVNVPEMPSIPTEMASNGPDLLVALREAKSTAETSSMRYSLDCLQLKGPTGSIAATDSRQLLVQTGFQFPWQDEVLMRATNVFSSSEIPSDLPVEIGRTADGVNVRVGTWTIFHEINKEGRFPNIDRTIPVPDAIATRMRVDAADAKFFADTVNRLPADDQTDRPLTLELNGAVVVRARKDEQSPMTELILTRSQRIGNQLRLQTNRGFLARALELGFTEIGFVDAESPCVCRDETRTYVWMLLEPKDSLGTSVTAQRIESCSALRNTTLERVTNAKTTKPARSEVVTTAAVVVPVNRVTEHLPQEAVTVTSHPSTDVIEQALAMRNQLRTIAQGLTDLVAQIRQQRKQNRLMKSTLQSLKQLQLLEA